MLYFWHSEQSEANRSHFRGTLFEDLLRRYLTARGYEVDVRRKKHNSLEYDIEGKHLVDGRPVIGEAKAHESTIAGQDLSAFVGKLLPLAKHKPKLSGLFLATSALSPEAEDYFDSLSFDSQDFSVDRITGGALEQEVRRALDLPTRDEAASLTKQHIPVCLFDHVVHTDVGTFVAVVGRCPGSGLPDRFAFVDRARNLIADSGLLTRIRAHVEAFRELEPASGTDGTLPNINGRSVIPGLILANDWLDYRRPAASAYFVGRTTHVMRINEVCQDAQPPSIIEIKARSGVGKSSLLAVLAEAWQTDGHRVELHDARDVHAATDVFALIERFTEYPAHVRRFEDVSPALRHLARTCGRRRSFFLIDQFESVLLSQEVFNAYEYLALAIVRLDAPLTLAVARKDDLLTTYDDIRVDLFRLRQLAHTVQLDDLTREESVTLLHAVSDAHPKLISKQLLNAVLEFAKGFPWLLKRTLAHTIAMLKRGVTQKDLLSSGLQLEELFEEEISSLDEMERGYLQRLAPVLPATYLALLQKYENDPVLPRILGTLTERRLLRLSGSTYDIYNDVFKEYIQYARLPESSSSFLLKMGPGSVMSAFRKLGGKTTLDVDSVTADLRKPIGSVHNLFRELRLLGLIVRTAGGWQIPDVVRQYEHQGRLGEFIRQSLLRNMAVLEFLSLLERNGAMKQVEVRKYLQDQFAFVQASSQVWIAYGRTFVSWLKHLKFIRMDRAGTVYPVAAERESVVAALGNLAVSKRGNRPVDAAFVPSRRLRVYLDILSDLAQGQKTPASGRRTRDAVLRDLRQLGAISVAEDGTVTQIVSADDFVKNCKELMSTGPYKRFWEMVRDSVPYADAIKTAFDFEGLSYVSLEAYGIMLVNWGKQLGFLATKRYRRGRGRRKTFAHATLFDLLDRERTFF
jgi:hypothetical protein